MARHDRQPELHEKVGSGRVGLAVMDIQTLHRGHVGLLNEMRMTCDVGIVGIGSTRQYGTEGHPFTFEQRKEMVRGVFGDAFRFVPLDDIDAKTDKRDWYAYVQRKIIGAGLPDPTDYFAGREFNSLSWYFHAFADLEMPMQDRIGSKVHTNPETGRRLHVVDRELAGVPSGRDIRAMIEMRDDRWKLHVAERLHRFVEWEYPPKLRQPIEFALVVDATTERHAYESLHAVRCEKGSVADYRSVTDFFETSQSPGVPAQTNGFDFLMALAADIGMAFPVGTRLADGAHSEVLELKDDGRWRPLPGEDEKARWARENRENRR